MYDLRLPDKRRFVRLFLESLLSLPRKLWTATLVVIDEAHKYAAEGEKCESTDAVIALQDQGRKRGLCGILATQRLAKLSKDASAEANNLLIGRFAQDTDQKRATDLLGTGHAGRSILRDFDPGEFYAYGPAFAHRGVMRFRADLPKTTAPKAGERHLAPPGPSREIRRVAPELKDLKLEIQKEEDEKEVLRHRSVELENEVSALRHRLEGAQDMKWNADALRDAERTGFETGWLKRGDEILADLRPVFGQVRTALDEILEGFKETVMPEPMFRYEPPVDTSRDWNPTGSKSANVLRLADQGGVTILRGTVPQVTKPLSMTNGIGKGAPTKCLRVLVQYTEPLEKTRVFALAGLSPNAGNSNNAIYALHGAGLVEYTDDKRVVATAKARREYADKFPPLPTGRALLDYWAAKLGGGAPGKCFDVLRRATRPMLKEEIFRAAGLSEAAGNSNNAIYKMRGLGLLHDHPDKRISLSRNLRP